MTVQEQIGQALDQLRRLYESLHALRREMVDRPQAFALIAEGHVDEIRRLQEELDSLSGVAASAEEGVPLWLRIVGPEIHWESAPTSVVTAVLDTFRKGVQSAAEMLLTGHLTTRPTATLKRSADFRIVALAPGSLRIGVRLPEGEPSETQAAVIQALDEYVRVAAWVASDAPDSEVEAAVPDARRRRLLLSEVARLLPRERGQIDHVEISGARVRRTLMRREIILKREQRPRVDGALTATAERRSEVLVGDLREVDLDDLSFVLRNLQVEGAAGLTAKCRFLEDLTDAVKEALDKPVRVTGSRLLIEGRRSSSPLQVTSLEIVEEG